MKKESKIIKTMQSGITLIALVITIILLIILAAVTLNFVLGENGLISRSTQASEKYREETAKEKLSAALSEYEIYRSTNDDSKTIYDCLENVGATVVSEDDNYYEIEIDGFIFQVDKETLEIMLLGKITGSSPEITGIDIEASSDKLTAIIKVTVKPVNNGNITVTIGKETAKYENGTYNTKVGKNSIYSVIVKEEGIYNKARDTVEVTDLTDITVTYHAEEGTINIPEQQIKDSLYNLKLSEQIPEKSGSKFIGWSLNKDDKDTSTNLYKPGQEYSENISIDLYAIWLDGFTITFNPNGGTGEEITQIKRYNIDTVLQENTFTKEGYTFVGWSLNNKNESYLYVDNGEYKENENVTLYASWIKNIEEEPNAQENIEADSLISAIEKIDKPDGYYNIIVNGKSNEGESQETYKIQLINIYKTIEYKENPILGSNKLDGSTVVVKFHEDLTINEGVTITTYNRKKGMFIYVNGILTNNGTITMSEKGAKAEGQNVYLWKNTQVGEDNNGIGGAYEYIPKLGSIGATSKQTSTQTYQYVYPNVEGAEGVGRKLAGGASGGAGKIGKGIIGKGGTGGQATSYSGGGGGGGTATRDKQLSPYNANLYEGGAGNRTTEGSYSGTAYSGRTIGGGLLIIYANTIQIGDNGLFESMGKPINGNSTAYKSGIYYSNGAGGGSGGGSINIFYKDSITGVEEEKFKLEADKYSPRGTYNVGTIKTGTYVPYK